MQSARLSRNRSRVGRRTSSTSKEDEEEPTSFSRPSTQDSKHSSYSRLSTDSGAGSLDDFNNRQNSSPDFWMGRRHTAPIRKLSSPDIGEDGVIRPNTVHAWDTCSQRCSLSRYAPLPAIGAKQDTFSTTFERPVPVRRQCFMGPLDIDNPENTSLEDPNENETEYQPTLNDIKPPPLFSLTLDTDTTDSDFDEESESVQQFISDSEDVEDRPRRTVIRSATFTIEKERPDIRGPFVAIAVRLPDGTRVTEKFDCKDMLASVCEFALDKLQWPKPERYALVTTDIPKRTFKDMTISLRDAGIEDKTLLCLQSLDDSDSE